MIDRYPAPQAAATFSESAKIRRWHALSVQFAADYARSQHRHDIVTEISRAPVPDSRAVRTREAATGHDVVAFLSVLMDQVKPETHPYWHFGLTSSDLVENAHFEALREHTYAMIDLVRILENKSHHPKIDYGVQSICPGRTHGQIAELTSWRWRFMVWRRTLSDIERELQALVREIRFTKTPGPTGQSALRAGVDQRQHWIPATQVIPRDHQVRWAALYLRLCTHVENMAALIRAGSRAGVAEVLEGASRDRVGSSAMPFKKNPVTSEQLCGLARVARGHFLAIAESAVLELDRDISNSSVERLAVPDLAAITEYMVTTLTTLIDGLEFFPGQMEENIDERCFSNALQSLFQRHAEVSPIEAGRLLRRITDEEHPDEWPDFAADLIRTITNEEYRGDQFMKDYMETHDRMRESY